MKTPVVVFIFKRSNSLPRIFGRISEAAPEKLYILADGPRNDREVEETEKCREEAEKLVTWKCEIIRRYSKTNRGVYRNIGLGAKWVLEREPRAIFLEDDNLPEVTFFRYCEELLDKYENDERIMWICGTNYLNQYKSDYSYMFTRHMLPCGWASWSWKYLKYYDGDLKNLEDQEKREMYKKTYFRNGAANRALYIQMLWAVERTKYLIDHSITKASWDFQMDYSVRSNNLFGISPCMNQIANVGVDQISEHGGTSLHKEMTNRFCGIGSMPLPFPLKHPVTIEIDPKYEKAIEKIVLYPLRDRIKRVCGRFVKRILAMNPNESLTAKIKR